MLSDKRKFRACMAVLLAGIMVFTAGCVVSASSAPSGQEPAKFKGFDPQVEPDRMDYTELDAKLGAMPAVKSDTKIGVVLNEISNEYWTTVAQGIEERCAELGITVELQHALSPQDTAGQLSAAETMANKGYDAYIFSPMTDDLFTNVTKQLVEQGKPVVNTYCMFIDGATSFVGALDSMIAVDAAKYTIKQLGGEGKVAICMGAVSDKMNATRCDTYKEYILANSKIEIAAELPTEWITENAMQMTADLMTTQPDVKLIYCANDKLALGVVEGLRSKGMVGKVMVTGMDGTALAKDSIHNGEMTATWDSSPYMTGQLSVNVVLRALAGQDVARVVAGPFAFVDKSNVDKK